MSLVNRKIEYRLYPTAKQHQLLQTSRRHHQRLYNAALRHRRMNWDILGKTVTFSEQCRALTTLRAREPEFAAVNAQSQQVTLHRVDHAYQGFFRRKKQGINPAGFPRFKSFTRYKVWGYKAHGDGWKLFTPADMRHGRVRLSGIGAIKIRGRAKTPGIPKTCEILYKAGRWYASITVVCSPTRERGTKAAGLDWGTEPLLTIVEQDGTSRHIANPRLTRQMATQLKTAQRNLSRKQRGSKNREKAKEQLGQLHRYVGDQRKNFLHQTTSRLIRDYGLLATEALNVKALTAAGGRRKRGFNREILSTAPGAFFKLLADKAAEAGSWYVALSPRTIQPTQTCYSCGRRDKKALSVREHSCPCGVRCGRDENAARVLLHWALIGNAPGSERTRCGEPSAGLDPTIETKLRSEKQESPASVA